jgi:hypothetical protein
MRGGEAVGYEGTACGLEFFLAEQPLVESTYSQLDKEHSLMKTKTLLMAAVMLVCFSAVASAQATFSVSSSPITTVIQTGNAELAGNITFISNGFASATGTNNTISIQYGGTNVNITSPWTGITITGTGTYTGAGLPTINTTASSYSPGLLVLNIPAVAAGAGSFTVNGVRVQISGTGLTSLTANISVAPATGGNTITAGQATVGVINSIAAGIASVTSYKDAVPVVIASGTTTGLPSINAVSGAFDVSTNTNTTIVVKEGFGAAFTQGVGVRITVSATPPKGVTFSFPATASSYDSTGTTAALSNWICGGSTTTTGSGTIATISSTSTSASSLMVNYYVATDNGDNNIDYLEIPVTVTSSPASETFPLAARQFTYTVSLAPVVGAYPSSGIPYSAPAPRFAALESAAANLASISGRTTALLIPFASTLSGFDTALSVSNTTEDPGATLLGVATAAAPQSGSVTFYFYPQSITLPVSSYTTVAASPGTGLDTSGNIISGGTYTVFVSQLVPLATPALTSFSGYIIAVTNFTNAHGIFVISNFTTLTAQSSMMEVLSDRSVLPERIVY